MRSILLIASLLCVVTTSLAVPARPGCLRWKTLADGRQIEVELRGDEHLHYWQDRDGTCYVENENLLLEVADPASLCQRAAERRAKASLHRLQRRQSLGGDHEPFVGQRKGLIILVAFSNKPFLPYGDNGQQDEARLVSYYERIANERHFSETPFVGSVRDYFLDNSYGLFDFSFDIAGPVTLQRDYEYYGQEMPGGTHDAHPALMVAEACRAVDADVDFSRYDSDGDGEVDQVFILYAGWLTPTELHDSRYVAMAPLSEKAEACVVRNEAHPDEYLLLENRQPSLWDAALPRRGSVVVRQGRKVLVR